MCGIFSVLNNSYMSDDVEKAFQKGYKRGPESSVIKFYDNKSFAFGFHRLAINGFKNPKSEQPLNYENCVLICNGEIYNWKYLHTILKIPMDSKSDCEIIIHLYKKFGIEYTLQILDGVFAFALYDMINERIYFARDTFGIRPLFFAHSDKSKNICFSSVIKCFTPLEKYGKLHIKQINPGSYTMFKKNNRSWDLIKYCKSFVNFPVINNELIGFDDCDTIIYNSLSLAVKKRIENTDRPIACLLSGGLDSSLITALVKKNLPKNGELHTWSIGFQGSEDLFYAQIVADFLGTIHHSIVVKEEEFLNAIPDVIEAIESYDTTTVRASVGNWLISKYIKENSEAKVVFNGDGSDELSGGYMYFHCAPNQIDFDFECKRLLKDIHYFDVLRSDRSISSHGLEARTPFLDVTFVQNYLSIPKDLRHDSHKNGCEKYLIRNAFCRKNLLPKEVLWRTKEAFSDGVSSKKKAWYEVIHDHLEDIQYKPIHSDEEYNAMHNPPTTLEQKYYRDIFNEKFPGHSYVIPYFWMPKFVEATDASARTLNVYKTKQKTPFRK
jgi:asparagine synthase (glutamine-hydrolysing)